MQNIILLQPWISPVFQCFLHPIIDYFDGRFCFSISFRVSWIGSDMFDLASCGELTELLANNLRTIVSRQAIGDTTRAELPL